jgi:hypothetical protein
MAEWKKVVVSGSAISQLQNDSNYLVSGDSGVELTGSFKGDGSQITGVTADVLGNSLTDGNGITDFTFDGSGAASVAVQADGSTLSVGVAGVKVADAGITATQLAASVAGDGLSGGAGTALSVNTDGTSITTSGDSLTLAGTVFSSSIDSRIDANASAIAGLDGNYATDAELAAVSSSASSDATSKANAAQAAAEATASSDATFKADMAQAAAEANASSDATSKANAAQAAAIAAAEAKDVVRAAAANAYADQAELDAVSTANGYTDTEVSSLSGSAHSQRVAIETSLDGKIGTEKGRIDAILDTVGADPDSFQDVVSLINSVDTTNDTAFAGFVTSSNARATAIEGSVTALSGSVLSVTEAIASDVALNTAKVGITTQQASDITANNAKISYDSAASTKLATIEESADVTDTANVTAAGALMDSEVTNLAQVKAFDSSDYLASSTTTISGAQASAIVANTAKVGITTQQASDITANNAKVGITSAQATAITDNASAISNLDSTYATDVALGQLSGSAHTARGVVASNATGEVSALSGSAHTARASVASAAASATSNLSGSVLGVTNALDSRIDTLEGVSHTHSNKANLDAINQDLGTSDNVNFNNLVVDGNLTVSGTTTTVDTANLLVEDKFILLNAGSADPDEGGIIIDEGAGSGHAFIYDKGDTRWGFNASVAQDASTANATAHAAAVVDMQNVAHADSAEYQKNGNIKVDSGDIFIYC